MQASRDNTLEAALLEEVTTEQKKMEQAKEAPTTAIAETPASREVDSLATPKAPVKLGDKALNPADKRAMALALDAVSQRDRRVGELLAMISETQRCILERDEQCQQIEEKISAARQDFAHLELDVDWHRRALDNAKERSNELEATQQKLQLDLDGQQQKLRHAGVEVRDSCLMSAQSEISTATGGGATASSLGCFTPRNHSALPDLSSPASARW